MLSIVFMITLALATMLLPPLLYSRWLRRQGFELPKCQFKRRRRR